MKNPDTSIKAGDKVIFDKQPNDYYNYHLTPGKEYTVKSVAVESWGDRANMLEVVADDRGMAATWYARRFTKVVSTRKPGYFNDGEIVKCINNRGYSTQLKKDELYKVVGQGTPTNTYVVSLAGNVTMPGVYGERFELVTPAEDVKPAAPAQWMVCNLDTNGKIKPSTNPRYMAGEKQAIAVAKSMATAHTDDTFAAVSFTVGATFRAEAVEVKTVKHEVRQVG